MSGPRHDIDKMVEQVLENFNFNKVYLTMKALGWTWGMQTTPPTVEDLKRTAEYLLRGSIDGAIKSRDLREWEGYLHATGGFKATAYRNRHKHIVSVQLEFIVTQWESDGYA
jgi:hypothetical protein